MLLEAAGLDQATVYKLLGGFVVPRPIAFISTVSADGVPNCAPFSFFNVVCTDPPLLGISIERRQGQKKDTVVNAEQTGDFVVNTVVESVVQAMNLASTEFPPEVNEFAEVGLTPAPSRLVKAPRIAEAPVNMECRVEQILNFGDQPRADFLIGRIVAFHIADGLVDDRFRADHTALRPVGRMSGASYVRVRDFYDVPRLTLEQYWARRAEQGGNR